jgi:hypothetical protein
LGFPRVHSFPPPWSVEDRRLLHRARRQGQALAYFKGEPGRRSAGSWREPCRPVGVYLAMKTMDEHSDNEQSEDRLIVERLQNAVSQTRQCIVHYASRDP